jgi:hypothetical protein
LCKVRNREKESKIFFGGKILFGQAHGLAPGNDE